MNKILVHTFSVTRRSEHIMFRIRIPENIKSVNGIQVSCDKNVVVTPITEKPDRALAGFISIRCADNGQMVVSEPVFCQTGITARETSPLEPNLPLNWGWYNGFALPAQFLPASATLLEGVYKDRFHNYETEGYTYRVTVTMLCTI
jgi:hypothetical protein